MEQLHLQENQYLINLLITILNNSDPLRTTTYLSYKTNQFASYDDKRILHFNKSSVISVFDFVQFQVLLT